MATRLTDEKVRALKPPVAGQAEHADSDVPGLRARIGRSGKVSWIVRKRIGGALRVVTIGAFGPALGVKQARAKARALISDLEAGRPIEQPKARPAGKRTLSALLPEYLEARRGKRRTLGEVERTWRANILPKLGDRQVESITRADVAALLRPIARNHPAMARNVRAELSAFYSRWALKEFDEIPGNPCRDVPPAEKPAPRKRVLDEAELGALWQVAERERWPWGPAVRLLILTGARRSEVFGAEWCEFDLDAAVWLIPADRAKNKVDHIVPLSDPAVELLRGLPVIDGSAKVFPAGRGDRKGEASASGFSKATARIKDALDKALEREDGEQWQLHDIRRTVATGLQRLGVAVTVTEAVLNHVSGTRGGIVGVYQVRLFEYETREALDLWAAEVARVVGARQSQ